MHFQYPQAFWLLLLIPFLIGTFWYYQQWKKKKRNLIGQPLLIKALLKGHSKAKERLRFGILMVAFLCGCLALANPRKREKGQSESRKGIDIVVALDVSNSMLANDVTPNRLQLAKNFISAIIKLVPNDRVGLVLFAGNAYTQVPLTYDHNAVTMFSDAAVPTLIRAQGTSLSDALTKSYLTFDDQSERFNSIILITDGETHDENAIKKGSELADEGIMISTVGIGSLQGASINDPQTNTAKKDEEGNIVITKLNEETLQQLASQSKGIYVHLTDVNNATTTLLQHFSAAAKETTSNFSQVNYQSFYFWFALPMLLLLMVEVFIPERKKEVK